MAAGFFFLALDIESSLCLFCRILNQSDGVFSFVF